MTTPNMERTHTPSLTESGGSPPNEKAHAQDEKNELLAKLPDPDMGKTEAERAEIVRIHPDFSPTYPLDYHVGGGGCPH